MMEQKGCNNYAYFRVLYFYIPLDLKYKGEQTTAEIGDNTTIREFVNHE